MATCGNRLGRQRRRTPKARRKHLGASHRRHKGPLRWSQPTAKPCRYLRQQAPKGTPTTTTDTRLPPPEDRRSHDRDRDRDGTDPDRDRDSDRDRDRHDSIRDIRDRNRDRGDRRPEFFGRSYGRSQAPRPSPELRHYEPSCGDDYKPPPRRFDPDDRREAVRIPSPDDRPKPPPSDDRNPSFDDRRPPPPPVSADDRRLTLDDRPIRRLPALPLTLGCSRQLLTTVLVQLVILSHSLGQPQVTIAAPVLPRLRVTTALEPMYHWKRGFRNPRSRPPSKTVSANLYLLSYLPVWISPLLPAWKSDFLRDPFPLVTMHALF